MSDDTPLIAQRSRDELERADFVAAAAELVQFAGKNSANPVNYGVAVSIGRRELRCRRA